MTAIVDVVPSRCAHLAFLARRAQCQACFFQPIISWKTRDSSFFSEWLTLDFQFFFAILHGRHAECVPPGSCRDVLL